RPCPAEAQARAAAAPAPVAAAGFDDSCEVGQMAASSALGFAQAGASQTLFFAVPVTKIVSKATLQLRYTAPFLRPGETTLVLSLNGTEVGRVPLRGGVDARADVLLPTDLLTTDNALSLQLLGVCQSCADLRMEWLRIRPWSSLVISGSRLPIPNDLSILPI